MLRRSVAACRLPHTWSEAFSGVCMLHFWFEGSGLVEVDPPAVELVVELLPEHRSRACAVVRVESVRSLRLCIEYHCVWKIPYHRNHGLAVAI